MRRAIKAHLGDFIAIIALFVVAVAIAGYILYNQRLTFPLVQKKPHIVRVELPNAQAVTPGQGQTVRVAGVEVGQIGKVELDNGRAVVDLELEGKYKNLIREDATALLRTKTGLKDMLIEVDPGEGEVLPKNQRIRIENTQEDVDPDQVLSALDADTRDYLKLLISGAGKGLKGRGSDLQETFARLGPLHRDLARTTRAFARRRANLRRLIHNYGLLMRELAGKDSDLTRLVQQSNAVLSAFASEDVNISRSVAKLPGTLRTTQSALVKTDRFAQQLGPTLEALRPPFRKLASANRQVIPLAREGTPIVRNRIRPFTRIARPRTRDVGQAAQNLNRGAGDLTETLLELNRLFNIGAHNPNGAEGLTGNLAADRARDEGYLYWLAWVVQMNVSLFSTSDAQGPLRRAFVGGVSCATLAALAAGATGNLPPELTNATAGLTGTLGLPNVTDPSSLAGLLGPGGLGACAG
jgi:phospholipid/cholesterol/gamma-HCH transport system substrate-binding protein